MLLPGLLQVNVYLLPSQFEVFQPVVLYSPHSPHFFLVDFQLFVPFLYLFLQSLNVGPVLFQLVVFLLGYSFQFLLLFLDFLDFEVSLFENPVHHLVKIALIRYKIFIYRSHFLLYLLDSFVQLLHLLSVSVYPVLQS